MSFTYISQKSFFVNGVKTLWREITAKKLKQIEDFAYTSKRLTNLLYKDLHEWMTQWKNISKEDRKLVEDIYTDYFKDRNAGEWLKSAFAQNIFQKATSSYYATKKAFFSDFTQNAIKNSKWNKNNNKWTGWKKRFFKKQHQDETKQFAFDYRMLSQKKNQETKLKDKVLIPDPSSKDKNNIEQPWIKSLYWLAIVNPFKINNISTKSGQKETAKERKARWENKKDDDMINIPLYFHQELEELYIAWYPYSIDIDKDHIKFTFKVPVEETVKQKLSKEMVKEWASTEEMVKDWLKVWAVDFGKYLSVVWSNWSKTQYNLRKAYTKHDKLKKEIKNLDKLISDKKKKKEFDTKYDRLKQQRRSIYERITAIRKHTYGFIWNRLKDKWICNQFDVLICEDLSFWQIPKKRLSKTSWKMINNERYKGKAFNRMISFMWRSLWKQIIWMKFSVGDRLLLKEPHYSSCGCPRCWNKDKRNRHWRKFKCLPCILSADSDLLAGLKLLWSDRAHSWIVPEDKLQAFLNTSAKVV